MASREIEETWPGRPTLEGAGVHLVRMFGYQDIPKLDPFLLLDHFGSDKVEDYIKGFPWHPHRGIETITCMLHGKVEHGDSLGNSGTIYPGDVQWMTAGSGIIHQEMPKPGKSGTLMEGFQLWANLPASQKMMDPRYRDIKENEIPAINLGDGVSASIVSGALNGTTGPVKDVVIDPLVALVSMENGTSVEIPVHDGHASFACVFRGSIMFHGEKKPVKPDTLVLFKHGGDSIECSAGPGGARMLLASGKPIGEPIAWGGPIVMNTSQELETAYADLRKGTFLKDSTG